MSRTRLVLASALLLLGGLIALVAWGGWFESAAAPVRPVPPGSRELAWIAPATSGETWERPRTNYSRDARCGGVAPRHRVESRTDSATSRAGFRILLQR